MVFNYTFAVEVKRQIQLCVQRGEDTYIRAVYLFERVLPCIWVMMHAVSSLHFYFNDVERMENIFFV